jgi:geranylgeranyl transferase type-2 subunit beta
VSTIPGTYLIQLTGRLAEGLEKVPQALRERHTAYLLRQQNSDGGFSGREGGSDLYYTAFALRGLLILGELKREIAERAANFLKQSLGKPVGVIDFFSLLYAAAVVQLAGGDDILAGTTPDWPDRVAQTLETFQIADGGYAREPGHHASSTYMTFLVGLCYELLGRAFPEPDAVHRFILSRRRDDGGFVEITQMKRSGTNPTAAAIGTLQLIGTGIDTVARSGVIDLLSTLSSSEGGIRANSRIPLADLLSTFTGTWTLLQLDALDRIDARSALQYALNLQGPDGGFRGGSWDNGIDVEYTFYGLGALALLYSIEPAGESGFAHASLRDAPHP